MEAFEPQHAALQMTKYNSNRKTKKTKRSIAPASMQCKRLIGVDLLTCIEDVPCKIGGLSVFDVDAVGVDFHMVELLLVAKHGNFVSKSKNSDVVWIEGMGGEWPRGGELIEGVEENRHTVRFRGRVDDVNDVLGELFLLSDPNYFGSDVVSVVVDDLGYYGSGGAKRVEMVIPVKVEGVDDFPVVVVGEGGGEVRLVEDEWSVLEGVEIL